MVFFCVVKFLWCVFGVMNLFDRCLRGVRVFVGGVFL